LVGCALTTLLLLYLIADRFPAPNRKTFLVYPNFKVDVPDDFPPFHRHSPRFLSLFCFVDQVEPLPSFSSKMRSSPRKHFFDLGFVPPVFFFGVTCLPLFYQYVLRFISPKIPFLWYTFFLQKTPSTGDSPSTPFVERSLLTDQCFSYLDLPTRR